jgi:hypothetical protein
MYLGTENTTLVVYQADLGNPGSLFKEIIFRKSG